MSQRDVCFITGASTGFGSAFARRLALEGYAVGLAARRGELLEVVAGEIRDAGGQAGVYPCDVSDREQVLEAERRCEEELGPVDLLIANAGISRNTLVDPFDVDWIERVIRTNLFGAIYATEGVLPGMLQRGRGRIAAISSLAGFQGLPMSAAYSASKAAMTNFFESLRIDLRGTGVHVTVIAPGFVKTPLTGHNRHPMPFLMELDPAVEKMTRAILKKKKSLAFPWPLAAAALAARNLPRPVFDLFVSKLRRGKSPEAGGPAES
ncbi:SDR family NAD(P)-dependent oxidoreductase [Gemmatimonadota bacterium]